MPLSPEPYTVLMTSLPDIRPMTLGVLPGPFSDPDWLFEVKYDGFRALAYVRLGTVDLVSRRRHVYKSFNTLCESIAAELRVQDAILDGEIVCVDQLGHPQFNKLMFRRGEPFFYAFDLVWLNGDDLRNLPLVDRKNGLQKIIPARSPRLLYVDHVNGRGDSLFRLVCERDLEGIVAKWKRGAYISGEDRTSWLEIKNSHYSQALGREKLFEKRSA